MLVIGLTGGVGSGKSTVSRLFEGYGVPVIDTDLIARTLTSTGQPAVAAIVAEFGEQCLLPDGTIDRAKLRQIVFSNERARKRLEVILHPLIRAEVVRALSGVEADYALVVVPLLVETGDYAGIVQRVLLVDCPEALQVERVVKRNGMSVSEVQRILSAQASRQARLARADDVISNEFEGEAFLRAQVAALHQKYRQWATGA